MDIIYKVTIAPTEVEKHFRITWHNVETNKVDFFDQSAKQIIKATAEGRWQNPLYQLETGCELFRFLDGDSRHLQRALDEAEKHGQPLQLHLSACNEAADWPFELLAKKDTFLLPVGLVHLIRRVSDWGSNKRIRPRKQALRLLFMACAPIDSKPELDFEREEEAIFNITENMNIDMDVEDSGSLQGLSEQLEHKGYDIVHLSGHAAIDNQGRPYFIMENETGCQRIVYPGELWDEALIENPPRLLFLSGCRTGEVPVTVGAAPVSFAHKLVKNHHVPAVLGWGRPVEDNQAIVAEEMLYKELSSGKTILQALKRARYELSKRSGSAWPLLRLFSSGLALNQIVAKNRTLSLKPRRMKYNYLENSRVKVLSEGFVGRRRQIQRSLHVLKKDKKKLGVLILGAGGLGKSCLAGKITERFTQHTLIIVHGKLNAITMEAALKDAFIRTQDHKGKKILATGKEIADKLAELCVTSFKDNNYLILFDDFEQNLEGAAKGQPGPLLPETVVLLKALLHYLQFSGKMTQLIITSRYEFTLTGQNEDLVGKRLEPIRLSAFYESEQHKKVWLLGHILKINDEGLTARLLVAGHGNPRLMEWIDVLVGQIEEEDVPQLIAEIANKKEEFIRQHVIRELLVYGGDELTLFLRRLSIFRRPVLKEGLRQLAEKAGLEEWNELTKKGIGLSLIEHDRARKMYQLTPLLRGELFSDLDEDETRTCHEVAYLYYKEICETEPLFDPILVEEWIFHALNCGEQDMASKQGARLVKHLRERLAFRESMQAGTWLLEVKGEKLTSKDDESLLNETALTMKELGEYDRAIDYYEKAFDIDLTIYGETHVNSCRNLNNLGMVWNAKGNYDKAIDYFDKALRILKEVAGEKHLDFTATLLNNLGLAWAAKGNLDMGISFYEQALEVWKELYNDEHEKVAIVFNNLGSAYNDRGEHDKAIDYFEKALSVNRSVYGNAHPETAGVMNNLGLAWLDKKDSRRAIECFDQTLVTWKRVYGGKHTTVVAALTNLASANRDLGKLKKAETFFKKALTIAESIYGKEHQNVVAIKKDLEAVREELEESRIKYASGGPAGS
jgi:tetratricopeptide (TPR) repeat protein